MRTVRSILRSRALRMRTASMATEQPVALSVAPVPPCQESKCAPSMTISSFLRPPSISPTTLKRIGGRIDELGLDIEFQLHGDVVLQQAHDAVVVFRRERDNRRRDGIVFFEASQGR